MTKNCAQGCGDPIEIVNLTRRYGRRIVVDDVSLACPAGSLTGLIGLNGAGKSTLLRSAVGLVRPTAGRAVLAGCDVAVDPVGMKHRVGYVPDRPNVYGWMRAGEAIAFTREFYPAWQWARCDELVARFRLPMGTKVKHLSKGQAAKLQLLLAVCHDPAVLILDEPTGGFDPIVREEFFESVLEWAVRDGRTVLFSSHALGDVQRLADRVALMHEGRLLLAGATDELLDRVKRVRVVFDDAFEPPPPPPGLLRQTRNGREWLLTLDRVDRAELERLKGRPGVGRLDVMDVNLDELFKDLVRGRDEVAA